METTDSKDGSLQDPAIVFLVIMSRSFYQKLDDLCEDIADEVDTEVWSLKQWSQEDEVNHVIGSA